MLGPPLVVMTMIRSTILKASAMVMVSTNRVVGCTSGMVIFRMISHPEAPSRCAAS